MANKFRWDSFGGRDKALQAKAREGVSQALDKAVNVADKVVNRK